MIENFKFYINAYKKYGISAKGLNWNSKKSQEARFSIIASSLKDELASSTIVDVGCGFGDLFFYLQKKEIFLKHYIGIDSISKFVKITQKRLKEFDNCTVLNRDILFDELPYANWYIASGSLNILNSFDTWIFLEKMLYYSTDGILFNILQGKDIKNGFNYQSKKSIKEFFRDKKVSIKIIDDYLRHDMTVIAKKYITY